MEEIIETIVVAVLTSCTMVAGVCVLSCIVEWWKKKGSRTENGIRVIKKGKIPTKKVECLHCHSIIEYDTMKVEYKYFPYIICPVCNEQIMLGQEKGGEE